MVKLRRRTADADAPVKEPWGPGPLILLGLVLVFVTGWCFKDIIWPGQQAATWRQEGKDWYIPLNWIVMVASVGGAAYSFVMAVVRLRRKGAAPPEG
jgi:heme/copper-type cytochrome/quinol oxidase subunit 2